MAKTALQFRHNGRDVAIFVDGGVNLLTALRELVGDMTPKFGCGQGGCGACTVLIDGDAHLSCLTLAETVARPLGAKRSTASRTDRICIRCSAPSWSISRRSAAIARRAC